MLGRLPTSLDRFLRFAAVGAMATILHFAVLVVLVEFYARGPTLATTVGYLTSAGFNYAANRTFTFRSGVAHRSALPRFAAMCAAGTLLNAAGMWWLTHAGFYYVLSQIITTLFVLAFNFTVASRWIFPAQPASQLEKEGSR